MGWRAEQAMTKHACERLGNEDGSVRFRGKLQVGRALATLRRIMVTEIRSRNAASA
jgi:hypothetical protein